MTGRTMAMLAGTLLLAACNPSGGEDVVLENVSLAEATEQARAANKLQPGQWQSQTRILSVEVPGAPKELADALNKSVNRTNDMSDCLTPEEAEKPAASMFAGTRAGECHYEKFAMAGGRMDATMLCRNQPGEIRMAMVGDYTPTGFALDMTMTMPPNEAMPGTQGMTMRARAEGKRTGECTAPAAPQGATQ